MIKNLTFGFFLLTTIAFGQAQQTIDSLIHQMCNTVNVSGNLPDTSRIFLTYREHLYPFLSQFQNDQQEEIETRIHLRMQMICGTYTDILMRLYPPNPEWEQIIEHPTQLPDKRVCQDLTKQNGYSYIEPTGDTVRLVLTNDYWIDNFRDGTYSKLRMHWLSDCEFEIEFIESNNFIRSSLSKVGDRYKYYVIEKGRDYYYLAVDQPGTNKLIRFKVFLRN
jgi:hypothetical protein